MEYILVLIPDLYKKNYTGVVVINRNIKNKEWTLLFQKLTKGQNSKIPFFFLLGKSVSFYTVVCLIDTFTKIK
jgi:hypothetical protein